ncbi:WD repeat-containing protein 24 [Entophlyctis luteolus]|nr:WD repeat-containing protein 24 [Entophlyctis luteolus]
MSRVSDLPIDSVSVNAGDADESGGRHGFASAAAAEKVLNTALAHDEPAKLATIKTRVPTKRHNLYSPLSVLSASPSKKSVVVGGKDVFKVLDIRANEIKEAVNLRTASKKALIAPQMIASAHMDGAIIIWDLGKGNQKQSSTIKEHFQSINRLAFHPTEAILLLSACQDHTMKLWDLREKSHTSTVFEGRADKVRDVQFSPTSQFEFIAASENGDVQKWDMRKPSEPERRWSAHVGFALTVDWHPDGAFFASAGRDRTIQIWDAKSERKDTIQKIHTINHVARIAWRPTETGIAAHQIASCSLATESKLSVWDIGRAFVPEWAVEQHDEPITGLLSGVVDNDNMSNPKANSKALESAKQAPGRRGSGGKKHHASAKGTEKNSPQVGTLTSPHPGPSKQLAAIYESETFNPVSFVHLAQEYNIGAGWERADGKGSFDEIWQACEENAKLADSLELPRASQTWRFLQLLFGIEAPAEKERMFKKGSFQELASATPSLSRHRKHSIGFSKPTETSDSDVISASTDLLLLQPKSGLSTPTISSKVPKLELKNVSLMQHTSFTLSASLGDYEPKERDADSDSFDDDEDEYRVSQERLRATAAEFGNFGIGLLNSAKGGVGLGVGSLSSQWSKSPLSKDASARLPPVSDGDDYGWMSSSEGPESVGSFHNENALAVRPTAGIRFGEVDQRDHALLESDVVSTPTGAWMFEEMHVPQLDREDLARDILSFYGDIGNSQMCATILMVLKGHVRGVKEDMKELWFTSYIGS